MSSPEEASMPRPPAPASTRKESIMPSIDTLGPEYPAQCPLCGSQITRLKGGTHLTAMEFGCDTTVHVHECEWWDIFQSDECLKKTIAARPLKASEATGPALGSGINA